MFDKFKKLFSNQKALNIDTLKFHREIKKGANSGCYVAEPLAGGSHSTGLDNMINEERERLESEGKKVIYFDPKGAF